MTALMPNSSVKDTPETSREKFIGKPLKSLYKNHAFSRKSFVLFLENADGSDRLRLGEDPSLSLLIMRNKQYAEYPIASIGRYYEQIHVVINPPEEEGKE